MNIIFLTSITMLAFAFNSIFGRIALQNEAIDPGSYSLIRLFSGAVVLILLLNIKIGFKRDNFNGGNWLSAASLFAYAAAFSFSYVNIETGMGALILFATVQATMIGWSVFKGDYPTIIEMFGIAIAFSAFIWLLSPGLEAPDPLAAFLMALSGIAWGIYSIKGKFESDPLRATTGNFLWSLPFAIVLSLLVLDQMNISAFGAFLAICSGGITSALGYALWYHVLPQMSSTKAAIVQLSVPVLAGIGGTLFLSEEWTFRFTLASILILGGIAISILAKNKR